MGDFEKWGGGGGGDFEMGGLIPLYGLCSFIINILHFRNAVFFFAVVVN